MRSARTIFCCVAAATILTTGNPCPLFAQAKWATKSRQQTEVSVPFVGCASSGQIETLEAPKGANKSLPMSSKDAHALAYYKSADGISLLAPTGWYCEGASGSGGYALFLSPKPIQHDLSGWHGLGGPAIEVNHLTSGASGAHEIAELLVRAFPSYRTFGANHLRFMGLPVPPGPYPKDTLEYRSEMIVEYTTPGQTEGLGNFDSWLGKNDLPIKGAAIITGDPPNVRGGPDLVLLSVRLPADLRGLIRVIVGQFERDTVGAQGN